MHTRLPRELRDIVYDNILGGPNMVERVCKRDYDRPRPHRARRDPGHLSCGTYTLYNEKKLRDESALVTLH